MTKKEKINLQSGIINSIPARPHGRLLLSPRLGKTRIVIELIKKNKPLSILWVTPSAKLATVDIPEEFKTWKATKYLPRLKTITWASLGKLMGHYDLIVLDEDQYMTENNITGILSGVIKYNYIISMTGTNTKHEHKSELYKLLKLNTLHEVSINEAVNIGILSDYKVNVVEIDLNTDKTITAGTKEKPFLTSEKDNYNYIDRITNTSMYTNSPNAKFNILKRMRLVHNSVTKTNLAKYLVDNLKGRKLFFCSNIQQAEALSENTYHSKTNNVALNKFISGEIDTITMVNAGGTGFTYREIDHLVIVQSDSNKNGSVLQKVSRTLLEQKNYKATIWILCLRGTKDEQWVNAALESLDKDKIEFINSKNLKL